MIGPEHPLSIPPAADPRIGAILEDRYQIVRKIGEGGMGTVYEAQHTVIERPFAIKFLHPHFAQNTDAVNRFHREAVAATAIRHQHIVEVTDMGRASDGALYMVLEFLEGFDWAHDIATTGPQSVEKVIHIVSQTCDALSAAHRKGIVHRDLKPENIFLIRHGEDPNFVKILDFGISKFRQRGSPSTQAGTVLGTPVYMAPEQIQGRKDVSHQVDIYALGVMMFKSLTGQLPIDDESYPMLVFKVCTEDPPPLRLYRPDIPEGLEQVVFRMLAKSPADRFQDCLAVKEALLPYRALRDTPVLNLAAPITSDLKASSIPPTTEIRKRSESPIPLALLSHQSSKISSSLSLPNFGAFTEQGQRKLWLLATGAGAILLALGTAFFALTFSLFGDQIMSAISGTKTAATREALVTKPHLTVSHDVVEPKNDPAPSIESATTKPEPVQDQQSSRTHATKTKSATLHFENTPTTPAVDESKKAPSPTRTRPHRTDEFRKQPPSLDDLQFPEFHRTKTQ